MYGIVTGEMEKCELYHVSCVVVCCRDRSLTSCEMQGKPSRLASSLSVRCCVRRNRQSCAQPLFSHEIAYVARRCAGPRHAGKSHPSPITSHPRFEQGGGGAVTCSRIASFKGAVESSMVWRKLCNNAYIAMATRGSMCERLAHATARCQRCCRPGGKSCPPLVVRILLV